MKLQNERIRLITRCPIWAILPEGFAALVAHLTSAAPLLEEARFLALNAAAAKMQTKGRGDSKIAVIPIQGVLTRDEPWAGTTYKTIADAAEQAGSDPSVKRVVLDADSPGGEVTGLPETAAILASLSKVKPVSAIVGGNAASAAYWLTSQASHITMAPSAEVGSVGVRVMHVDVSKAMSDAGIKVTELSSGKFKTEWTPYAPLTGDAAGDMQKKLAAAHNDFVTAIAEGRRVAPNRPTSAIVRARYGEGRMFSANEAIGHGLADAVQSPREFYKAIMAAQETTNDNGLPQFPLRGARTRLELERNRV